MPGITRSNILSYVLLGLVRHRPMYGYELFQSLEQQTALGLIWHVKQPHLYALLGKLEDDGWLEGEAESHGSRPPRRVMRATPTGAAAFDQWFLTPVRHGRDFRQEFLAQLYFAQTRGPAATNDLIQRQRVASGARRDLLQTQLDGITPDRPYDRLVYEFRLRQMETILNWLDTCQDTLRALPGPAEEAAPLNPSQG